MYIHVCSVSDAITNRARARSWPAQAALKFCMPARNNYAMADLALQSVKILRDGRSMPLLGLGTYLGEADAVKTALELGYRLIDTASLYESGN